MPKFTKESQAVTKSTAKAPVRPSAPTAAEVARYNRYSGHPNSNHMQADGTIVVQPLGAGK